MTRDKKINLGDIPKLRDGFFRRINLIESNQVTPEIATDFIFGLERLFKGFPITVPKSQKDLGSKKIEVKSYLFPPNNYEEQD